MSEWIICVEHGHNGLGKIEKTYLGKWDWIYEDLAAKGVDVPELCGCTWLDTLSDYDRKPTEDEACAAIREYYSDPTTNDGVELNIYDDTSEGRKECLERWADNDKILDALIEKVGGVEDTVYFVACASGDSYYTTFKHAARTMFATCGEANGAIVEGRVALGYFIHKGKNSFDLTEVDNYDVVGSRPTDDEHSEIAQAIECQSGHSASYCASAGPEHGLARAVRLDEDGDEYAVLITDNGGLYDVEVVETDNIDLHLTQMVTDTCTQDLSGWDYHLGKANALGLPEEDLSQEGPFRVLVEAQHGWQGAVQRNTYRWLEAEDGEPAEFTSREEATEAIEEASADRYLPHGTLGYAYAVVE